MNASQDTAAAPVADRRAELLAIGRQLFAKHAYDELSIDDVAAAAGVAKGLLYYYFRSKRGFYLATIRAEADELLELAQPDPALPPAERLRRTLDCYLAFVDEASERFRALYLAGLGSDPEIRAIRDRDRAEFLRLIAEGVAHQAEPSPTLRTALEGWLSFVEGVSLDWLDHRDLPAPQVRELLVAALAGSLTAALAVDPTLEIDFSVL
ncbi:MAG TPA: TetR/AcrR family transcriptional regulator [Conexibacter sp.]|nr:TetR/AcrR family transcriptional regulator [Conexibacter sp.]